MGAELGQSPVTAGLPPRSLSFPSPCCVPDREKKGSAPRRKRNLTEDREIYIFGIQNVVYSLGMFLSVKSAGKSERTEMPLEEFSDDSSVPVSAHGEDGTLLTPLGVAGL